MKFTEKQIKIRIKQWYVGSFMFFIGCIILAFLFKQFKGILIFIGLAGGIGFSGLGAYIERKYRIIQKSLEDQGLLASCEVKHIYGLDIGEISCLLELSDDNLKIIAGNNEFIIKNDKICAAEIKTDVEMVEENIISFNYYMIINYINKDEILSCLCFDSGTNNVGYTMITKLKDIIAFDEKNVTEL